MRFSIRELFWLTLVVGLAVTLWIERRAHSETDAKRVSAVGLNQRQRTTLVAAKESLDELNSELQLWIRGKKRADQIDYDFEYFDAVDWSILDEPLVEP
jgi:hypothetical protein